MTADGVPGDEMNEFTNAFTVHREIDDIALNRPVVRDQSGQTINFRYTAVIADAGVGKTKVTEWIEYRCHQPDSNTMAFRFDLKTLIHRHGLNCENVGNHLTEVMAKQWHDRMPEAMRNTVPVERLQTQLRSFLRRPGCICLIFDGLDQCSKGDLDILVTILASHEFGNCRYVVAGRPQAYTTNWNALFAKYPWRLVRVEGMSRTQQIRYLGWLPDRSLRYDKVPRGARTLLSNPRIMSYLRQWRDFADIRSAADVYWKTIDRLVLDGMSRSAKASLIGLPAGRQPTFDPVEHNYAITGDQVRTAIDLLAIIAFETKRHCQKFKPSWTIDWESTGKLPGPPEQSPPPYDYNVVVDSEVQKLRREHFKGRAAERNLDGDFETNWEGIAALNSGFLDHGIFEDDRGGLKELVWANKSLHEFLLAYFFANLADDADTHYLWDWIYLKDQYATEDYYWFWQYLCEMPAAARCRENWLNAIRMIYQPGICRSQRSKTRQLIHAKRSTEMIFRSWWTLDGYIQEENDPEGTASAIRIRWLGEFEQIRLGEYGDETRSIAQQIVDHLLPIDLNKIKHFKMGTSAEKQGFRSYSSDIQQRIRVEFDGFVADPGRITTWFDQFIQSKATLEWRERLEPRWRAFARRTDINAAFDEYVNSRWPANEAEIGYENLPIESFPNFALGRQTICNIFFRLFDPGHGVRESQLWPNYAGYSESPEHPCIYVSWYDAWVYSRFLCWDGLSCQLPRENQWECAAKYGFGWDDWEHAYWWGRDFEKARDTSRINCFESQYKKTLVPSPQRANPLTVAIDPKRIGLMDMLGNVWEWCDDPFPDASRSYSASSESLIRDPNVSRSCRGGSFDDDAFFTRCSFRFHYDPSDADLFDGFRVARAQTENL